MKHVLYCLAVVLGFGAGAANASLVTDDAFDNGSGGPDILSLSGFYDSVNLYLSGRYRPGTFDSTGVASGVLIGLDDLNLASPGCCGGTGFFPIGADYGLNYTSTAVDGAGQFRLRSILGADQTFIAYLTPTFVEDGFDLSVPLNLIGGSGLFTFGMASGNATAGRTFTPTDFLVDTGPVVHGPTSPVPLPAPLVLLTSSLLGLAGLRRRRAHGPAAV